MNTLKSKLTLTMVILLTTLSFEVSHACISNEYNKAYSLFKHSDYRDSLLGFTDLYKGGCPTSPYFLGIHYAYGLGVKQNYEIAIKYFNDFLDKDNGKQPRSYRANTYLALAIIYKSKGQLQKAHEYLVESAKIGNTEAMFLLGRSYIDKTQPYYTQTNLKGAFFWLNKAALYGNVAAMKLINDNSLYDSKS